MLITTMQITLVAVLLPVLMTVVYHEIRNRLNHQTLFHLIRREAECSGKFCR